MNVKILFKFFQSDFMLDPQVRLRQLTDALTDGRTDGQPDGRTDWAVLPEQVGTSNLHKRAHFHQDYRVHFKKTKKRKVT